MTKLVIHAPTVGAWRRAQRNLTNLLAVEPEAIVELVVNAEAAVAAIAAPDPSVSRYVVVCENSLRAANVDLPPGFRSTPVAISHISQRQAEGWAYFRA